MARLEHIDHNTLHCNLVTTSNSMKTVVHNDAKTEMMEKQAKNQIPIFFSIKYEKLSLYCQSDTKF